ncbi:MAG TPA: ribulose-phosphate 3-epimerase [Verrucomicrobiae bacterium]|jgi:ribulose-phosphate 3-epimerase|nr:ribulose-phosphate 3-epimerase [Verrucomicrobiae bacterium]
MNEKPWIAPSILSADFARLGEEVRDVEKAGCDWIHVDVMDGHFVPNLTIGPPVVKALRKVTKLPLDVHLMIDEPLRYIEDFCKAGSDWVTIHVEATQKAKETLDAIQARGAKRGMSLRPKTPVEALEPYLKELDLILIMSVEPGFGGQSFMPEMMDKVRWLRPRFKGLISVDGGVKADNSRMVREAGADILVAGTAVFGFPDRGDAIKKLRVA